MIKTISDLIICASIVGFVGVNSAYAQNDSNKCISRSPEICVGDDVVFAGWFSLYYYPATVHSILPDGTIYLVEPGYEEPTWKSDKYAVYPLNEADGVSAEFENVRDEYIAIGDKVYSGNGEELGEVTRFYRGYYRGSYVFAIEGPEGGTTYWYSGDVYSNPPLR